MKKRHIYLFLLAILFSVILQSCSPVVYSNSNPEGIPNHPRIILLKEKEQKLLEKINKRSDLSKINSLVISIADGYLNTEAIKRKMTGRRMLFVSRAYLKKILFLSYSYRITKDKKYLTQAKKNMLAASAFPDWNPSHFLDVAEMTTALSIGYDWLYKELDLESKQIIREAIVNKGLLPSIESDQWWLKATNNWNQICNAGMVFGALAVYEDVPELAQKIIERAEISIQLPLKEYEPDGVYVEGPGYWGYGTTFNVLLFDAVDKIPSIGQAFNTPKGFLKSGDYILNICGPKGYFNYSDCGTNCAFLPVVSWFSSKLNNKQLLWNQKGYLQRLVNGKASSNFRGMDLTFLPFLIIWGSDLNNFNADKPVQKSWIGKGKNPIAIHRTAWEKDAIFIAIKGGSPSLNHAHMDVGSFVMDADGVRWAIDLGAHNYNKLESKGLNIWSMNQVSQRWDVFRYTNFAHNTLTVNNQLQQVDGYGKIIKNSDTKNFSYTVVDISSCYKNLLKSAVRGIAIVNNNYVLIRDEIINENMNNTLRWNMVTQEKIKTGDDNTAVIMKGNKSLTFKVISPKNIKIRTYSTDPPNSFEDKNPGTKMVGFEMKLKPYQQTELIILLVPGSRQVPDEINIGKLSDW